MAARLHGKSPVDYLVTARSRAAVMAVAEFALGAAHPSIEGVLGFVGDHRSQGQRPLASPQASAMRRPLSEGGTR
jgi:hypothetical protein